MARSILRPFGVLTLAIGLAGCASLGAQGGTTPPLSPDQVAAVSAIVAAAQAAGNLAISRTKSPQEVKIIQAAQAGLASAWQTYQADVAAKAPVSTTALETAAAAVMAAVIEAEAVPVPNSGASSLPLPPPPPSSQSP